MRIGRAAAVTDTGRKRLRNEDAFVCEPPLFAVADGMGGARAGETAARLAAAALEEVDAHAKGAHGVSALIGEANRRIWERSLSDPQTAGMGTTVTAALVGDGGEVTIGHVGDSRAYLLRAGGLEQLTTDHSLVAELVESGVLTPEEAERHPQRSAITRALGTEPTVEVDLFTVTGSPGDLFLLCSDGLSIVLDDETIRSLIDDAEGEPTRAAESLVAAANAQGGPDNITVVLFELVEDGRDAAAEAVPPAIAAQSVESGAEPSASPGAGPEADGDRGAEPARHGAGPGGRLAALLLLVAVLALAALLLYWGTLR